MNTVCFMFMVIFLITNYIYSEFSCMSDKALVILGGKWYLFKTWPLILEFTNCRGFWTDLCYIERLAFIVYTRFMVTFYSRLAFLRVRSVCCVLVEPMDAFSKGYDFLCAAGASQVKWNKLNSNLLATTHDGDIRIWDPRVSSHHILSLFKLAAHGTCVFIAGDA